MFSFFHNFISKNQVTKLLIHKIKLILYPRIKNSTTQWRQKELFLLLLILQLGKSPFYVSSKNNTPATDLLHTQMSQNYYINLIFIWYKHKLKMWPTPLILCLVLFKTGKSYLMIHLLSFKQPWLHFNFARKYGTINWSLQSCLIFLMYIHTSIF